jgi:HEAT repeat protein
MAFAQQQQVDTVFMPILLQVLRDDPDPSVRGDIALALGKIDGGPVEKLEVCHALSAAFYATPSPTLRSDILLALSKISDSNFTKRPSQAVLTEALEDTDASVRYNAALSLARQEYDKPEVIAVLLDSLLDTEAPEAPYRQEVIALLAHARQKQPGRPDIKEALLRSLADTDQAVREAAANALAVIGEGDDRRSTGESLVQQLDRYKRIAERQLSADPTIEATLCALQHVMGDT